MEMRIAMNTDKRNNRKETVRKDGVISSFLYSHFFHITFLISHLLLFAACSSIDDDLSDCPTDEAQYQMEYELKLVTNMTTELQTQLTTITELSVASALETHLENIFSDFAHDVNLSFYDTETTKERLEHRVDIINTNQTTYDLTLPMRKYLHLAVANIAENHVVGLFKDDHSPTSMLQQAEGTVASGSSNNIVDSHTTGLFTARQPMEVLSGVSQTFNVRLYMANSAATLVLDPKGHTFKDIRVYATGFAKEFHISDSTYVFPTISPLIRADKVETGNDLLCYCTVNFPSPDAVPASSAKRRADEETPLWQIKVYLTKTDDSVTETVLDITEPLKAGNLKIIKGALDDEGAVRPYDSTVGVSVTLDWNKGGTYDPEL